MRTPGRYLQFRHAFPEFFAPGLQARRGLVRLRWLLLGNVDFRPLWTVGVSAGLVGIMLSMVLLVLPPDVQLSAATVSGQSPPAVSIQSQRPATTSTPPIIAPPGSSSFGPYGRPSIDAFFTHLSKRYGWDDRRIGVTVSQPKEYVPPLFGGYAPADGWSLAHARPASLPPAFAPYREPAGLRSWEPVTPKVLVSARGSQAIAKVAHPTVRVEKRADGTAPPQGLLHYELVVTNTGTAPVPDVNVFEALDVRRVTSVAPPALVEPNGLTWRLGGLAPSEQRKLTFAVAVDGLPQATSITEVELADHFSAVISVAAESPYYGNSPPAIPAIPSTSVPRSSIPAGAVPPRSSIPPSGGVPRSSIPQGANVPPRSSIPQQRPPQQPVQPPVQQPQPTYKPILHLKSIPAEGGAVGDDVATWYEVSNTGNAPAVDVLLTVDLPQGLVHHDGSCTVRHRMARVAPGETRRAQLITRIAAPGQHALDSRLTSGDITERQIVELVVPAAAPDAIMFSHLPKIADGEVVQTGLESVPPDASAPLWTPYREADAAPPPWTPEPAAPSGELFAPPDAPATLPVNSEPPDWPATPDLPAPPENGWREAGTLPPLL